MGDAVPAYDLPGGQQVPAEDMPVASTTDYSQPTPQAVPSGAQHLEDAAGTVGRHPFTTGIGMLENELRGITGGVGSFADAVTGSPPGTHDWAYQPRTQAGQELEKEGGAETSNISNIYDRAFGGGPLATTLKERLPEAGDAVGTVLGAGSVAKALLPDIDLMKPPVVPAGAPHPLQGVANAETQRLADVDTRLAQQGIDLPSDRETTPIVKQSNNVVAKDLNLPANAPLTDNMIEAGIKQNALPAYAEVRKIAPWETSPTYEATMKGINTNLIDEDIRPPVGGELDGAETVRLSQNLRNRGAAYWKASSNNPAFRPIAAAHDAAAEAVENEFENHVSDVPGLSDAWDAARTYVAKAKNVEAALDGAGNVRPTLLKTQMLKGKPLSGGVQDLAIAAAKYPDYFKPTPAAPPAVGLPRRIAAGFAPSAGAAGGAAVGGAFGVPTLGALIGEQGGQKLSSILNPYKRQ
jgi:hypothetical protein